MRHRRTRRGRRLLVWVMVASAPGVNSAHAGAMQDQAVVAAAIRQAAGASLPAHASLTLGPLQGASYMPACAAPLLVSITGNAPYEQAAVHCPGLGWTLYVSVTVAASASVMVAARPIIAGQIVTSADIAPRLEPMALYAGRQVFFTPSHLVGATAQMNLPAGSILTAGSVAEPVVVKAGQSVSVDVVGNNISISVTAVANQSGRAGDVIDMTNSSTGAHFPAVVTDTGVQVTVQ